MTVLTVIFTFDFGAVPLSLTVQWPFARAAGLKAVYVTTSDYNSIHDVEDGKNKTPFYSKTEWKEL